MGKEIEPWQALRPTRLLSSPPGHTPPISWPISAPSAKQFYMCFPTLVSLPYITRSLFSLDVVAPVFAFGDVLGQSRDSNSVSQP